VTERSPLGLSQLTNGELTNTLGYHEGDFHEAEQACRKLLALPIYPELNEDQQHYVVQAVRKWFER
jgi:dTDP-4-amino-4,6-dideoxygalactose transaminase